MPTPRKKTVGRLSWTKAHRDQLWSGSDWSGEAWGRKDPRSHPDLRLPPWPPEDVKADMRAAWEHFGPELMEEAADTLRRPWAFWFFDAADADGRAPVYMSPDPEAARLDRLGLLTPAALAKAADDEQYTHGVQNECYSPTFRRVWGWWRFLSPERRDDSLEAVQLVRLENQYGGILTDRERFILANHADVPTYSRVNHASVTRDEAEALGLPASMYESDREYLDRRRLAREEQSK